MLFRSFFLNVIPLVKVYHTLRTDCNQMSYFILILPYHHISNEYPPAVPSNHPISTVHPHTCSNIRPRHRTVSRYCKYLIPNRFPKIHGLLPYKIQISSLLFPFYRYRPLCDRHQNLLTPFVPLCPSLSLFVPLCPSLSHFVYNCYFF